MATESNTASTETSLNMAKVGTMTTQSSSSSLSSGQEKPAAEEGVTAFQRHAAVLNNVGGILFQRGNELDAMRVYRESVQTLIQATDNTECRLNKKRQDEMQDYLNYLLSSKEHLERVSQLEHSAERYSGVNVAVVGSPELSSLGQTACPKYIAGLFQSTSRLKVAKHSGSHTPCILSFDSPYSIQLKGKSESSQMEKQRLVKARSDTCEVPITHVAEATMFNMGLIHAQWGSTDSALQYFQLAITVSSSHDTAAPGLRNPIVLAALSNVGQLYCQTGRIEEAMGVLSDASARCRAAMILLQADQQREGTVTPKPRISPQVASLNRTLARIMVNLGNAQFCYCAYDEARQTCEEALRLLRGQSTRPEAAAIWFNMAVIEEHQHHRLKALQYYKRFLKAVYRIVGADHPNVADALFRIGCVYYDMGQLQKALPPLLQALGMRAKYETETHFSMAEIYHQIGKVMQSREECDGALKALSTALEIQRKSSQECPEGNICEVCLELSETLLNLGRLHHGRGDFVESLKAYREVFGISLRIFGKSHPQTARLHVIIANLELEAGLVTDSMSSFEAAARIELTHGGPDSLTLDRTTIKVKNPLVRVTFSHHPCAASA